MSVSIYDFFANDEEIALEKEWLYIRDMFLCANHVRRNWRESFQLARKCKHVEAVYLAKLFPPSGDYTTHQSVKNILSSQFSNDARAMYYYAIFCGGESKHSLLEKSASLGFGPAISCAFRHQRGQSRLEYAKMGIATRDRRSFFNMGMVKKDNQYVLIAAKLGLVDAMLQLATNYDVLDYRKWIWLDQAVQHDEVNIFLTIVFKNIYHGACLFQIGKTLSKTIDYENKKIFRSEYIFKQKIYVVQKAIDFYKYQLACYRAAVDAWSIIGLRNRIYKDLRHMIGLWIWSARHEATYDAEPVDMRFEVVTIQEEEVEWKWI